MRANPNDTFAPTPSSFVKSGSSITVTIGRNVGSEPLGDEGWARFQADVIDRITALVRPSFTFTYYGVGEWQGITEESAAILFGGTEYTANAADVSSVLSVLAEEYGQDAIGFSFGPSLLATRA